MSENKNPIHGHVPVMYKDADSLQFRKEVLLWESITTIPAESKAGNIVFNLPKKAKAVTLEINTEELGKRVNGGTDKTPTQISGVKRLLKVLDGVYTLP